jgi:hypothetical protein
MIFNGSGTNTMSGAFTQSSGTLKVARTGAFAAFSNYTFSAGYLQNTYGSALTGVDALIPAAGILNLNGTQLYLNGSGAAASIEVAGQFNNAGANNRVVYSNLSSGAQLTLSGTINLSSDTTARALTVNGKGDGAINLTGVFSATSSAGSTLIAGTFVKGALGDLNIVPTSSLNAPVNGNLVISGGTASFRTANTQSFSLQKIDVLGNTALNIDYDTNNVTTTVGANSGAYRTVNLVGGTLNFTANRLAATTETLGTLQLAYGSANGTLRFFQIHNGTTLHATPALPAKTEHAWATIAFDARNQADHFG